MLFNLTYDGTKLEFTLKSKSGTLIYSDNITGTTDEANILGNLTLVWILDLFQNPTILLQMAEMKLTRSPKRLRLLR